MAVGMCLGSGVDSKGGVTGEGMKRTGKAQTASARVKATICVTTRITRDKISSRVELL